jgi:hypothetical protein
MHATLRPKNRNRQLVRFKHRRKDNIEMKLGETVCGGMHRIQMDSDRLQRWELVNGFFKRRKHLNGCQLSKEDVCHEASYLILRIF